MLIDWEYQSTLRLCVGRTKNCVPFALGRLLWQGLEIDMATSENRKQETNMSYSFNKNTSRGYSVVMDRPRGLWESGRLENGGFWGWMGSGPLINFIYDCNHAKNLSGCCGSRAWLLVKLQSLLSSLGEPKGGPDSTSSQPQARQGIYNRNGCSWALCNSQLAAI